MATVAKAILLDLGRMAYNPAHELQQKCVQWRLAERKRADLFLVVEHLPVFTLGKRGGRQSLMVSEQFLAEKGVDLVETERGGDITYHGPGQLVIYPIINLKERQLSVTAYVELLEEIMIEIAAAFGVTAGRDSRNRGVWVGDNKIGSIGIRVRHGVTFHGLALNINIDFEHFSWINPCGLQQVGVTSIANETGKAVSFGEVKEYAVERIRRKFCCEFTAMSVEQFFN